MNPIDRIRTDIATIANALHHFTRTPSTLADTTHRGDAHVAIRSVLDRLEELERDAARLDWLDRMNTALNKHHGTVYKWRMVRSHNVNRLMVDSKFVGEMASLDLHDSDARGFGSCRDAIDAAIKEGV